MIRTDQSHPVPPSAWADPVPVAPRAPRWRRVLPLAAWSGCLAAAVALLLWLGDGRLATPGLTDVAGWRTWAEGRDPVEATMAVLRLGGLGLAWYLTGVTGISVVARLLRATRMVRLADALSVGPVKVLVQQAVGVGLAASVVATAVPTAPAPARAAAGADRQQVAVMVPLDDTPDDSAREVMAPVPGPGSDPGEGGGSTPATQAPPEPPVAAGPTREPAGPTSAPGAVPEVRVEPGDHFWAFAEEAVAEHLGRPGTEAEVAGHWEVLLAVNADRLVVAGNPDLLRPGQRILLPPVGAEEMAS